MDFRRETVAELATQVQSREVSARELVSHALERIEALNPELGAFCAVDDERALADAARLDEWIVSGEQVGPLAGIPIGVKDLEHAAGFVTTFGSGVHAHDPPAVEDSLLVARLRAAGAVVVGKTNTPEHGFAGITDNLTFGPTRNPWDPARNAGGSSGGSAAAIASGMVPLATGSDAGGSIRIPSALCGLSGIKTSQGRVPNGGPTPPAATVLSSRGPMTRTIRDAVLALDACVGPDHTDLFSFPGLHDPWHPQLEEVERPERVVFSRTLGFASVDDEVAGAVEAAVQELAEAGTEVIELEEIFDEDPTLHWFQLWCAARARSQGHLRGTPQWDLIDPQLRSLIDYGERLTAVDVVRAIDACHLVNHRLETVAFPHAPVLLCPTVAGQAPVIDHQGTVNGEETAGWVTFTPFVNLSRNPAGTVNCGFTRGGLPIGLQVIGRQREDLTVLQALASIEDLLAMDQLAPIG
ncbi:MAG: amidase [Acidimicrobiales bacterium]|nr:amidase [Acidimicrobiales bacterium]